MLKLHPARLPDASLATQRTVLAPMGNVEPERGVQTTVTPGQLSVAGGAGKTTLAPLAPVAATTRLVEQTIVGGSRSTTTMTWLQVAVLPHSSSPLPCTVFV